MDSMVIVLIGSGLAILAGLILGFFITKWMDKTIFKSQRSPQSVPPQGKK